MKLIEAKKQINLGPARALQLALSGMLYRFFRSGITVAILCLAVAFLVHTLMHGLLTHATEFSAFREIREQRELGALVGRMSRPDSPGMVLDSLAEDRSTRLDEYRTWGRLEDDELAQVGETAKRILQAESYLESLPDDNRAILMGDADILTLLRRFQQRAQYELYLERVEQLALRHPLDGEADFRRLVQVEWPRLSEVLERIREGQNRAIENIREAYPGIGIRQLLIEPPDNFAEVLEQVGFAAQEIDFGRLSEFAAWAEDRQRLEAALTERMVHTALLRRMNVGSEDLSSIAVFNWLASRRGDPQWLSGLLSQSGVEIAPERLDGLADYFIRSDRLQEVAGVEPPTEEAGIFSLEGRLRWLILLAFCVCIVGVANAMLMSVTERFTEIATMKCLGALDGFVMMMFVFEAAIQGFIGGLVGIALGTLLAFARGFVEYGTLLTLTPQIVAQIALAALLSLVVGILLAVLAAVGPSLVAARLAPMEAMRVE